MDASAGWHPSAAISTLQRRARILKTIREFFNARGLLEVETPLLCSASVTDPYINSIETESGYLQTSPEYAMKRLLASGSGSIYQLCKAFRKGDLGQIHNPEFTMLEWYHVGFDHHQLMDEMNELLKTILAVDNAERLTYEALFQQYFNINPHTATITDLCDIARQQALSINTDIDNVTTWLQVLMSHCIEPELGKTRPVFIYDFPMAQAALARVRNNTASRFEVYYKGMELANGFHELTDADEQRRRFEANLQERAASNLPVIPIDELFLSALASGLPDCAGVALGVDRLVMLAANCDKIGDVVSFDYSRA